MDGTSTRVPIERSSNLGEARSRREEAGLSWEAIGRNPELDVAAAHSILLSRVVVELGGEDCGGIDFGWSGTFLPFSGYQRLLGALSQGGD